MLKIPENMRESSDELMESDQHVLNFLDSMDTYLVLMDSLSSTLRQGWMELASARHSMGTTRVSSSLFDLKSHRASTTVQVNNVDDDVELPHFQLCKWASIDDPGKYYLEAKFKDDELSPTKPDIQLAQHDESQHRKAESGGSPVSPSAKSPVSPDNHAQKARYRLLSMFGTLVSPKLRSTQLSFETALEMLVEISNVRASLLRAHNKVQNDDLKDAK